MLAALVVILKSNDGTLIVTVTEPDAEVQVTNEEGKVEISRKGSPESISISIDPGKHRLKVSKDGFELFTREFSLEANGKEQITAKLAPREELPASVDMKPVPVADSTPTQLAFKMPGFENWVKDVKAMPPVQQVEAVRTKLMELNPGFDGKLTPNVTSGFVMELVFVADHVTDISPVSALVHLKNLSCEGSRARNMKPVGKLSDLSPLKGMNLTLLSIVNTQVADLSPLRGMQLRRLFCMATNVADLSPLQGMPLTHLQIEETLVSDLAPLAGMPLASIVVSNTAVSDLSPLKGMPLQTLKIRDTQVRDLAQLKGMSLEIFDVASTG
jgi:hypothetical protein